MCRLPTWLNRRPDPDAAERDKRVAAEHHASEIAETEAVRHYFEAVKGHAELAKRRAEWEIKENHLAPRIAKALREK